MNDTANAGKCPFVGDSCGFPHWEKALGMYIFDDPLCEPAMKERVET